MDLSIILVTYNSSLFIRECLRSLCEGVKDIEHEILVVDNASCDKTCEIIEREFPKIHLMRNSTNLGFAAANNLALRRARGEFVLLINPDTRWRRGKIRNALQFLKEHPKVGGLGARLLLKDGSWQKSFGSFPSLYQEVKRILFPQKILNGSKGLKGRFISMGEKEKVPVDWISCTFFLAKREVLVEAGLFDERYFMYYEDIDLSKRIRERGREIYYYPEIEIVHFQRSPMLYDDGKSPYIYFHKHFGLSFAKRLRWVLVSKFFLRVVVFLVFTFLTRWKGFKEKYELNKRSLRFHLFEAGNVLKQLRNGV